MFNKIFSTLLFLAFTVVSQAQSPSLFTYGNESVSRAEFERVFLKNSPKGQIPDEKSINEYLDLYINFKLKVKEATALGLDTFESYRKELAGYRKQLAQPYLSDKSITEELIREAYDRSLWEVRASHILVFVDEYALPKDTLAAYEKILSLRNDIMKGASFDSVATYSSEDPSAKFNNGDLGFFTVFNLIYAFETQAYNANIGEVTMPFRTRFGYHLVKVKEKRPARKSIKIAHIMLKLGGDNTANAQVKSRIDSIYNRLSQGGNFEELCALFSQDEGTAKKGGVLNIIQSLDARFPEEFKEAGFELKNIGDISKPVKTNFGWHILKLIDVMPIPDYDSKKDELKTRVNRDMRAEKNRNLVVSRIKKENGFKENPSTLKKFYKAVDSAVIKGNWKGNPKHKVMSKMMFSIGSKKLTAADFAQYIIDYQTPRTNIGIIPAVNSYYAEFVKQSVLAYEEEHLEEKNDTFKNLFKEYHDGILLFELNDKKVWSKASTDTVGLQKFFEANQSNYQWKKRAEASVFDCNNATTAASVQKMIKEGKNADTIQKILNAQNALAIGLKDSKFEEKENNYVDSLGWEVGIKTFVENNKTVVVWIRNILPAGPKKLNDAKGIITADYQSYLDKEWIKELRTKYPVKVDESVKAVLFK